MYNCEVTLTLFLVLWYFNHFIVNIIFGPLSRILTRIRAPHLSIDVDVKSPAENIQWIHY